MFTGLLLICLLGTTECRVETSPTFFDTLEQCEDVSMAIYKRINMEGDNSFYVLDTACVGWGEKLQ